MPGCSGEEKIEGLERIRFMTSHPKDLSDELIEVMGIPKRYAGTSTFLCSQEAPGFCRQ